VDLEPPRHRQGHIGRKGLIERRDMVGVQVAHDKHDALGVGAANVKEPADLVRPVLFRAALAGGHMPPAGQRPTEQE